MAVKLRYAAAAVLVGGMLVLGFWGGDLLQKRSVAGLRTAVYGECHRQNLGRITGNRNNYSQYKLWDAALTLFQFGETQPATGKPNPQAALLLKALLTAMSTQLHTESWTPLSNCEQATDHPLTYVPPAAVPFAQQLPPLSAFTIGPNE